MVDLTKVAAHYAVSSLFEKYSDKDRIFCYLVNTEDYRTTDCGKSRLLMGRSRVTSEITGETAVISYGVFHLGGRVINAGVCNCQGEEAYQAMVREMTEVCSAEDITGVVLLLEKHFGSSAYSLKSLFRDEQRKVLGHILESTMSEIEMAYRQLFEHHFPPVRFLSELGGPVPRVFHSAAELIINIALHRAVNRDVIEAENVRSLIDTAGTWQVELDADGIGYDFKINLEKMMQALVTAPENIDSMRNVLSAAELARGLPFPVDLWKVQNLYWGLLQTVYPEFKLKDSRKDGPASAWVEAFTALGKQLLIRVG
jgi:hypothetical protein